MIAVDTNILLYAQDSRDPRKQAIAAALLATVVDGVLLWQVACEYIAASRKLQALGYTQEQAFDDVRRIRGFWTTTLPAWNVYDSAELLIGRFSLSFWDALIVAACLDAGVDRLYTEDFGSQTSIDGLEIINPFI